MKAQSVTAIWKQHVKKYGMPLKNWLNHMKEMYRTTKNEDPDANPQGFEKWLHYRFRTNKNRHALDMEKIGSEGQSGEDTRQTPPPTVTDPADASQESVLNMCAAGGPEGKTKTGEPEIKPAVTPEMGTKDPGSLPWIKRPMWMGMTPITIGLTSIAILTIGTVVTVAIVKASNKGE